MLIYHCCSLRAAIAICAVKIEGSDAMLAESALECGAARSSVWLCNISHLHCSSSTCPGFGQ